MRRPEQWTAQRQPVWTNNRRRTAGHNPGEEPVWPKGESKAESGTK